LSGGAVADRKKKEGENNKFLKRGKTDDTDQREKKGPERKKVPKKEKSTGNECRWFFINGKKSSGANVEKRDASKIRLKRETKAEKHIEEGVEKKITDVR